MVEVEVEVVFFVCFLFDICCGLKENMVEDMICQVRAFCSLHSFNH